MPTELLLPAFALTLLANAALVAVAVRWLIRARSERDRLDQADRPTARRTIVARPETAAEPLFSPPPLPIVERPSPAPPPEPVRRPIAAPHPRPAPTCTPGPDRHPRRRRGPGAGRPQARRSQGRVQETSGESRRRDAPASRQPGAGPRPKRATGDDTTRSETRRGGRRRFSLPPLDDDHERMTRSIETFLSGGDQADAVSAGDDGTDTPTVATTVALVAIHGLDADGPGRSRAVDDMIATVERTLRSAARSADRVSAVGSGRFRIVLAATGELAARAYLRRVRATLGPSLERPMGRSGSSPQRRPFSMRPSRSRSLRPRPGLIPPSPARPARRPTTSRGSRRIDPARRDHAPAGPAAPSGGRHPHRPGLPGRPDEEHDSRSLPQPRRPDRGLLQAERAEDDRIAPRRRDDRPADRPHLIAISERSAVGSPEGRDRQQPHHRDEDRDRQERLVHLGRVRRELPARASPTDRAQVRRRQVAVPRLPLAPPTEDGGQLPAGQRDQRRQRGGVQPSTGLPVEQDGDERACHAPPTTARVSSRLPTPGSRIRPGSAPNQAGWRRT